MGVPAAITPRSRAPTGRPLTSRARLMAATLVACVALGLVVTAQQQAVTPFTTQDYRKDKDRWTDPAYYLHNTARELTDMQVDNRFGQKGSGKDEYDVKSPYPFKTSTEHYQAWLKKANGGTK